MSVMKIEDRKIIVETMIDREFVPALMKKVMPFVEELTAKRMYVTQYKQEIGLPISVPVTTLDIKAELEMLSRKICILLEKNK